MDLGQRCDRDEFIWRCVEVGKAENRLHRIRKVIYLHRYDEKNISSNQSSYIIYGIGCCFIVYSFLHIEA